MYFPQWYPLSLSSSIEFISYSIKYQQQSCGGLWSKISLVSFIETSFTYLPIKRFSYSPVVIIVFPLKICSISCGLFMLSHPYFFGDADLSHETNASFHLSLELPLMKSLVFCPLLLAHSGAR